MDTLKIIISKANSIRFAEVNTKGQGFDNTLAPDEVHSTKPKIYFKQIFFKDDVVLIQIKAGLTATVVLTQEFEDGSSSIIAAAGTTTTSEFKIYDYTVTFSTLGCSYFTAESEESAWISEDVETINEESDYLLLQWSNQDPGNDTFEFDYNTTASLVNVNFMRIHAEVDTYEPALDSVIYENQTEKTKLKSTLFRVLTLVSEPLPRQIAEKITIAMQHDLFIVNEVGFAVEEPPELTPKGALFEMKVKITLKSGLGYNTHDIGFECPTTSEVMIENYKKTNQSGADIISVSAGYGVTQVIIKKVSGTPVVKVGSTGSGDEIVYKGEIQDTIPPAIINTRFTPNSDGSAWTIYITTTGGVIDILIQTIKFITI